MAPVLETERLILRGHRARGFSRPCRDVDRSAHLAAYRRCRHAAKKNSGLRFLRNQGQWQLMGYGMWALEDKASGAYAGAVGFITGKRDDGHRPIATNRKWAG